MSLDVKVVPDTNVVVASSIMENAGELGIKHPFYEQSIQLFSLFKDSDIGLTMPKVRSECFAVLSKAVKSVYIPENKLDVALKEKFYNESVAIISASEYKMRDLLSRLIAVKLNSREVSKNLKNVRQMSKDLMHRYIATYSSPTRRKQETEERSKPVLTEPAWEKDQKTEAVHTHRGQVTREAKQLERFMRTYPNKSDQMILAEVITFKKSLAEDNPDVLIASSDSGFSPPTITMGANLTSSQKKSTTDSASRVIIPKRFSAWQAESCNCTTQNAN